jgi:Tfp pilus assembly protein PilO
VSSYEAFVGTSQNVLGGNPGGTGDQDGDNAKIVLDALPSKYDFPAMTTSLEKLITGQGMQIVGITGTDQEVVEHANQTSSSPAPVAMPFQIQVTGSYQAAQNLVNVFERSIRPFQIQTMELGGDQGNMTVDIAAQTFYQPEKSLKIKNEVVK